MNNQLVKKVVATGFGAAVFVVIGILVNIPTFVPNTNVQLQYAVQALFAVLYGPVVGFLVGFIGHAVKDAIQYGSPWWAWVIASGAVGFVIGFVARYLNVEKGIFNTKDILTFNGVQAVANIVAFGILAPLGDIYIHAEASDKVFAQGAIAAVVNIITIAVGGTLLLKTYAKTRTQSGSLTKE